MLPSTPLSNRTTQRQPSLRIGIISKSERMPSTRALVVAARARGHSAICLRSEDISLRYATGVSELTFDRGGGIEIDVAIPRLSSASVSHGLAILDELSRRGVPCLNDASAIARARNPLRCVQLLANAGVPVPKTIIASRVDRLQETVESVDGFPIILRFVHSDDRKTKVVCESMTALSSAAEAVMGLGHNIVIQRYTPPKFETKVLVVGGAVVGRSGQKPNDRREDVGTARANASPEVVAEAAARALGLWVCSVDVRRSATGHEVWGVSSVPQLTSEQDGIAIEDAADKVIAAAQALYGAHKT